MCTGSRTRMSGKITTLLPFIDEMFEQLAKHLFVCYIYGYSGYHQPLFIRMIRVRPPSPAPLAHLPFRWMPVGLAVHLLLSKVYDGDFSLTLSRTSWKYSWMTSQYTAEAWRLPWESNNDPQEIRRDTFGPQLTKCHFMVREAAVLGTRFSPIIYVPYWNVPFRSRCDASDYAIGAVLCQYKDK